MKKTFLMMTALRVAMASAPSFAANLTHRWSFNGTTDVANLTDSVGGAVGWKEKWPSTASSTHEQSGNVSFSNGKAIIAGGGGAGYLNLGTGLLGTGDGTIEIWLKKLFIGNVWGYLFAFGLHDTAGDPGLLTVGNNRYNDATRTPVNFRVNSSNTGIYGDDAGWPIPNGTACHVSVTFKQNGSGGTFVRCVFRDCSTGFILKEASCTVNGWTLANAADWALTLGHNPWVNSNYDANSEFDEVRCWDGVLDDDQLTANILLGPDSLPGGGEANVIIEPGQTFSVSTHGGYGFRTDKTVMLGAGAKIRFDTAGYFGKGLRFKTGGIIVPSGSVLDFVELSDTENYVATMQDANTILVQLKPTIPYESTWTGGTPSSASDFANPANWNSVNAAGTTISAAPTNTTTVILPAAALATFTLPSGFTPDWGRVLIGGHTKAKYGYKDGAPNNDTAEWRDLALSSYVNVGDIPNGKNDISYFNGTKDTPYSPSELGTAQIRLDGWFYVTAAQAGKWTFPNKFDDVSAFAIDGEWLYLLNTYRIDSNGGAFVSEGWHRYTFIGGDTGGGYGVRYNLNGTYVPFAISINGAANVAFAEGNFTFGSDTDTVTLSQDCDWRALGDLDVAGGVMIDLNGHSLAVADISRSSLGAVITNSSATASSLYVNSLPSASLAQASGMVSDVAIVQYGSKSAVWTGAANDGNALNAGNWTVRNGAGMTVAGLPDNETAVTISGGNVNLQIPSGSTFQCASLSFGSCTLTTDCDWRGLSVTPAITGTADLNGFNLRLNRLSAGGGASLANGGDGVSGVVFDAAAGSYAESSYIDGIANLGTSENARIVILRDADDTVSSLTVGNTANKWTELRLTSGSISGSGTAQLLNTANAHGILTIDGADVTVNAMNAPNGNIAGSVDLNVNSGSFTVTTWTDFGNSASAVVKVNQTGGTVEVGKVRSGTNSGNGNFWFGRANSGTATYNLSNGTFTSYGSLRLGSTSNTTGIFNQSGGTVNVTGNQDFSFGYDSGSSGKYYQTGGTLNTQRNIDLRRSGAVLDIGGAVTATAAGIGVNIGTTSGSSGEVILREGGILTTSYIKKGLGTAKATFSGGKIVAKDASNAATFISGIGDITYAVGGLTVDTAGYSVTMLGNTNAIALASSALVKQSAGTLTVDSLPPVDAVRVEGGTLALTADGGVRPAVNAAQGNEYTASPSDALLADNYLLHRWTFNGHSYDLVGTNNAVFKGTGTVSYQNGGTEVNLPGGGRGTAWIDCGSNIIPSELGDTPFTIEFWAKVNNLHNWDQWFAFGNSADANGTGGGLTGLIIAPKSGSGNYPSFRMVGAKTSNNVAVGSGNLTTGKEYHVAVVVKPTGKSSATVTAYIEDPSGGEAIRVKSESVTGWSTSTIVQNNFWLGHSHWNDQDIAANYNEVRVWAAALSQEQVVANGALGSNELPVLSETSMLGMTRSLVIASGATLDLGGNTLAQPVVSGGGTVQNGTLNVANELRVKDLNDCLAISGGAFNIDGSKIVFDDLTPLATARGTITLVRAVNGGTITGTPLQSDTDTQLSRYPGWRITVISSSVTLRKDGLSVFIR